MQGFTTIPIVIASDHGEEFGEHNSFEHFFIYDETSHVPLIFHVPGLEPKRIDWIVENIDIMPTLLDLVGIPIPDSVQGNSLFNSPFQNQDSSAKSAFTQQYDMLSVRDRNWRLVINGEGVKNKQGMLMPKLELLKVELGNDLPANLAESNPDTVGRLKSILLNWVAENLNCTNHHSKEWWLKVGPETKQMILETGYW
jgi:arylsulfatase A-like enzyme